MRRTLEATFTLVQELHLYLCYDKNYSKLKFSERDKIIAGTLGVSQALVSNARRGTNDYFKFNGIALPYFKYDSRWPASKLLEIVQCACSNIMAEKEPRTSPRELDAIIAGWLGFSPQTMRYARLGDDKFRGLRGNVNPLFKTRVYNGAENTFHAVSKCYGRGLKYEWFVEMRVGKRDLAVANALHLKKSTVIAVRRAIGHYSRLGGFSVIERGKRRPHIRIKKPHDNASAP